MIAIFLVVCAVVSLSIFTTGEKINDINLLVERDGLFYKKFSDEPFTGEVIDGLHKGQLRNGRKQGLWKYFGSNGQLRSKGKYKNGEREGFWIDYYTQLGSVWTKKNYENGKLEGDYETYYDSGALSRKGRFKNDMMDGLWVNYWENGQLHSKGRFINKEKRQGEWIYCGSPKIQKLTGIYENDVKIAENPNADCGDSQ